jgi:hypothetical protein
VLTVNVKTINISKMNFKVIDVEFATKADFLKILQTILKKPAFCDNAPLDLERIEILLKQFTDDISFVIEYPYIDKHYRDSYYCYHSAKFKKIARDCIRVHIFTGSLANTGELFSLNEEQKAAKYAGYFIIRPLPRFPLGRSLLSPRVLKNHDFVCCLTKNKISLLGIDLTVHGFPHVAQDKETHSCAESSLWSILEYFSSKYQQYNPLLPSQIVQDLTGFAGHRLLPTGGLTVPELLRCLQANGHQCMIYHTGKTEADRKNLHSLMQIYIESGIPLLAALSKKGSGHAVLAIGHGNNLGYQIPKGKTWLDISPFPKKVVFIDDNMPPYQLADPENPTVHYSDRKLRDLSIQSVIVPLQKHMHLDAKRAFALVTAIFDDQKIGLKSFGGQWITRLLLTGGRSFKNALLHDTTLDSKLKELLQCMALPKFIWVCELYKADEFKQGRCSGLMIIDATGDNALASVLWYALQDKRMVHDGSAWIETRKLTKQFVMNTYRNNLKGEWNEWVS